ncbi:MAG: D-alanyl-D-alanine dipeptidase [Elusimicrobiota bacterium]|nr:D-alanyl-D-alanine dipeptidase [Elusimicrobiota bacterium]
MLTALLVMTALPLAEPLIDLQAFIPDAVLDIRYATKDNLTGRPLYPFAAAFLRRSAADKLSRAAADLRAKGRRLVIYDAYRPLSAQKALWAAKPDPRFVADPAKGSSHNRAGAVDVALADAAGAKLAMPSDFDDFGPLARHGAPGVPPEARRNAEILRAALEAAGFVSYAGEWWHYRDPDAAEWPVLDVPFEAAAR